MSAPTDAPKPSVTAVPESPTTARPLEMDDDEVQESGVVDATQASAGVPAPPSDVPPPKPPRPVSEQQQNAVMLKEAFPSVDEAVIKAILVASRGQVEPAFNALLQMTDPDAAKDDGDDGQGQGQQPPPHPPRPARQNVPPSSTSMTQLEADEMYARQLAEHFENVGAYEERTSNRGPYQGRVPRQQTGLDPRHEEREYSFVDDELPLIKENLKKGFIETQSKFNEWFTTVKKKIDGDVEDPDYHDDGPRPGRGRGGRGQGDSSRRVNDYDRYDADPQLLTDDFAGMKLHGDGTPARQARPTQMGQMGQMGMANPNLFRPPPKSTSPGARKVAFNDHVQDIDDIYDAGPGKPTPKDAPTQGKASKWQPLSTVEPNPVAENDPFSLGDSEDEKESKDKTGAKSEQGHLQKATAEAMADSLMDSTPKPGADVKKA